MASIASIVRDLIYEDISIQDALQRGFANLSAIARVIRPQVEAAIGKRVNKETLVTSLKRVRLEYEGVPTGIREVVSRSVVNVRTHIVKLSLERSRRSLRTVRHLLASYQEEFLQVSESISAVTLIFDERLLEQIRRAFAKSDIMEEATVLAAIIVRSPTAIIKTPGCAITFLNYISRRHINIEDVVSCYTDTIIVVKMQDAGKAFEALAQLISQAKELLAR